MSEYIERGALEAKADSCGNHDKIKTSFAHIIVGGEVEKPYYSILWLDEASREYYIGYSSYYLTFVRAWLEEEFEVIEEAPRRRCGGG